MGKTGRKNKTYSPEFKISFIMNMRDHYLSYKETVRKYELGNPKTGGTTAMLQRWERIFLEEEAEGLMKERQGRDCKACEHEKVAHLNLKKVEEDLITENQRLRIEIDCFKKLPDDATPLFHSDQGWQYQHAEYQRLLKEHNITQSMSRKGNCMDNGATENFFGRLKVEMFYSENSRALTLLLMN